MPYLNFQKQKKVLATIGTLLWLLPLTGSSVAFSGGPDDQSKYTGETRIYNTVHIKSEKPKIDGVLDDACWLEGEWSGNYRQQLPAEGASPSQKTEIKVLYDDENIYVAIKAFDNEPDKIDRLMTRRDELNGDIVGVNFDSYFDHRTGFEFNLTASGCKIDLMLLNDGWDTNWNAVWDGKAGQMDSGWVAEMRIPLSQLRYSSKDVQVWGMHSWRWINRNQEEDQWNLIPRDNAGMLYYFGELHGLNNLPKVRRIEFLPYVLGKVRTYEKEEGNPFADGTDPAASLGLDGKFGIGSNFTVDYTINPDFGQVEADPSELNLTAFETFYEEKRPFFMEGRNIFEMGIDENQLFYSRRIGHAPTYEPETGTGEYVRKPDYTTILGALKLSGKTEKGLSVGIMENLTAKEYAEISSPEGDSKMVSEPLTNYFIGRIQQDINKSNTIIGGMLTSTYRNIDHDYLNQMSRSALTGGIDFRHYIKNKTFYIDFKGLASQVTGEPEAITALQQESSRYYQRPDAPHLKLDTTLTSLAGHGGSFEFVKGANGKWRYGIGAHWSSPGLELNDMGFQNSADIFFEGQTVSYVENTPKGIFRSYEIGISELNFWNFGGEFIQSEWELEAESQFENKWGLHAQVSRTGKALDVNLLRGGPGVYVYGKTEQDYFVNTDESKKISFGMGYENQLSDDKVSNLHEFNTHLNWKITPSFQVSPEFRFINSTNDYQYIPNSELEDQARYLLGRLNRKTYEFTFRLNYAITPDFTIQYYGSPYITMGQYSEFKSLEDPDTKDPDKVFRTYGPDELTCNADTRTYALSDGIDPDPDLSFENPDFNFRELRSNLVARWEYRPGSVLYLVWTHDRTSFEDVTNDELGYNFKGLFNEHPENVFLIKFSYWFSL
jgi:hypothetical protein